MISQTPVRVPFVDLHRQHAVLQDAFVQSLKDIIDQNAFILGNPLTEFEQSFAKWLGVRFALGVASGTDALHLALRAIGVTAGDEVIIPAMTFAATALAVVYTGATPVVCDIHAADGLIDISKIEATVTSRTKAVIPVHLYGKACDLAGLQELAKKKKIQVIEDACQAHGAIYQNRKVGGYGIAGCFSFFPSKNLGALGDGGMVVTNNESIYQKLSALRNYGQKVKYHHDTIGYNSRLDPLQARFLSVKLPHLDAWNADRRKHARRYLAGLKDLPVTPLTNLHTRDEEHVHHLFVIRSDKRDELQNHLHKQGIETGIHYPFAIHQLGFAKGVVRTAPCPEAERLAKEGLSLPMFPELTDPELDQVIESIRHFFRHG